MNRCGKAVAGAAIIGTNLIALPPVAAAQPGAQAHAVLLTGAGSLDGGVALVMGPSGVPTPAPSYLEAIEQLYLPHDADGKFDGTVVGVTTPEGLNPITGPKSLPFDTSEARGQDILDSQIMTEIKDGYGTAEHPIYVFGYSQSSVISAQLMPELTQQLDQMHSEGQYTDVTAANIHFVMVADESIPNGGSLSSFDLPPGSHPDAAALGLTISGAQHNDLFPTDVYTQEYDGFADFPRYPIDELSTLNALIGILTQHTTYANLTADQIEGARLLPHTMTDTLTNYYMIPSAQLPLLEPLLLLPGIGKPLYDLLEPDTRILVDLGYGSIDEGWNQGPADVPTPVGFLPTNINLGDLAGALFNGAKTGVGDALGDLRHLDFHPAGPLLLDNPVLAHIVDGFRTWGVPLDAHPTLIEFAQLLLSNFTGYPVSDAALGSSSLGDIIGALGATVSADIDNLTPFADTIGALLTTLPTAGVNVLLDSIKDGQPLQGLDEIIGGVAGMVPFAAFYGMAVPLANEFGGTLINLAELFDLGNLQI